jgi:hypothetical protein
MTTLSEHDAIDQITILADGHLEIRHRLTIQRGGAPVAHSYHRRVISPGDDCAAEDPRTRAIARAVHTPDVVAAYRRKSGSG